MKTREQLIKQQKHLLEVYEKVKDSLSIYPNVVNVVIGIKETGGELGEEGCIKLIVKEKKSQKDLKPNEIIPKEIEGVKTDVIIYEEEILQAVCTDDRGADYRPIKGGIYIKNYRKGSGIGGGGTLGCVAKLNSDDSWVILSNHHVLYGNTGQDGDEIGQPWVGCSWCCKTNVIAENFDKDETLDCAIAKVKSDVSIDNIILEVGDIQANGAVAAVNGERVRKRGARTGFTSGTISAIDPANGKVTVLPNAPGGPNNDPGGCTNYESGVTIFTNPGDSGSVYVNDNNEVVALHYAGLKSSNGSRGNDIIRIQTALGITINTTSSEPGVVLESKIDIPSFVADDESVTYNNGWIEFITNELDKTVSGQNILSLFRKHENELFSLINHKRQVTVVWQRKQGPAFLAAFGRSVKHKGYSLPKEINRVSLQNLLMSMTSILEEYGSDPLRQDIQLYALDIIQLSRQCNSAQDFLDLVKRFDKNETIHSPVNI